MKPTFFTRRNVMSSVASVFSVVGVTSLFAQKAFAKKNEPVQKLNRDGKPADGTQMITPLIIHNGLIYIAGQGANSNGPVSKDDIDSHSDQSDGERKRDSLRLGGGSMDSVLQLTVSPD